MKKSTVKAILCALNSHINHGETNTRKHFFKSWRTQLILGIFFALLVFQIIEYQQFNALSFLLGLYTLLISIFIRIFFLGKGGLYGVIATLIDKEKLKAEMEKRGLNQKKKPVAPKKLSQNKTLNKWVIITLIIIAVLTVASFELYYYCGLL